MLILVKSFANNRKYDWHLVSSLLIIFVNNGHVSVKKMNTALDMDENLQITYLEYMLMAKQEKKSTHGL